LTRARTAGNTRRHVETTRKSGPVVVAPPIEGEGPGSNIDLHLT
jgi:hypothetical protein